MDLLKIAIIQKLKQERIDKWKESPKRPEITAEIGTKGSPPIPPGYTPNPKIDAESDYAGSVQEDGY